MITPSLQRPDSLHEIAIRTQCAIENYPAHVKEFMDELHKARPETRFDRIREAPALTGNAVFDAHLAGLAEQIAATYGVSRPVWIEEPSRFLSEPVFFGGRHTRALMLATTSACMRRRNLFCGIVEV